MNRTIFLAGKIDRSKGLFNGAYWVKETHIMGITPRPSNIFLVNRTDQGWLWKTWDGKEKGVMTEDGLLKFYRYQTERDFEAGRSWKVGT